MYERKPYKLTEKVIQKEAVTVEIQFTGTNQPTIDFNNFEVAHAEMAFFIWKEINDDKLTEQGIYAIFPTGNDEYDWVKITGKTEYVIWPY